MSEGWKTNAILAADENDSIILEGRLLLRMAGINPVVICKDINPMQHRATRVLQAFPLILI